MHPFIGCMLWLPRPFETNWSLTQCRSPFRLISSNKRFPQPVSAAGWVQPLHQTHCITTQIMFVCLADADIRGPAVHARITLKLTFKCDILILKVKQCFLSQTTKLLPFCPKCDSYRRHPLLFSHRYRLLSPCYASASCTADVAVTPLTYRSVGAWSSARCTRKFGCSQPLFFFFFFPSSKRVSLDRQDECVSVHRLRWKP